MEVATTHDVNIIEVQADNVIDDVDNVDDIVKGDIRQYQVVDVVNWGCRSCRQHSSLTW